MWRRIILIVAGCLALSCVRVEEKSDMVEVAFSPLENKSSISAGENEVNSMAVFAYSNGQLESSAVWKSSDAGPLTLRMVSGRLYNLYALANVNSSGMPLHEADIPAYSTGISSLKDMDGGLPMSWDSKGRQFSTNSKVVMDMVRLAACMDLSLDRSALKGTRITSARLLNVSKDCLPFSSSHKADTSAEVLDGDYADASDLATLNSGGTISLFALENCQGKLLKSNLTPWSKVPPAEKQAVCTCLEISCEFLEPSPFSGEVVYRLYPGMNMLDDFTILRNTRLKLNLSLTDVGMEMAVQIADNRTEYKDGLASCTIAEGFHDLGDFYVGENFKMKLNLSPELTDGMTEDRFSSLRVILAYENQTGIHDMEDDYVYISEIYSEDDGYYFDMKAMEQISVAYDCYLYLYDELRECPVCRLKATNSQSDAVFTKYARLLFCNIDNNGNCIPGTLDKPDIDIVINGDELRLGLVLADEDLVPFTDDNFEISNYHTPSCRIFPSDLMSASMSEYEIETVLSCIKISVTGTDEPYPKARWQAHIRAVNDGSDYTKNLFLSKSVMMRDHLSFTAQSSMCHNITPCTLDVLPWKAWLLGEYTMCGFNTHPQDGDKTQVALYNPSKVALRLDMGLLLHSSLAAKGGHMIYFADSDSRTRDAWVSLMETDMNYAISDYDAVIDACEVKVYRCQKKALRNCDIATRYDYHMASYTDNSMLKNAYSDAGSGIWSEVCIHTLGGYEPAGCVVTDLMGQTSAPAFYTYKYKGMNLWQNGVLTSRAGIQALDGSIDEIKKVMHVQGSDISFRWGSDGKLHCAISASDNSACFKIKATPVYYVYLRYTNNGGTTYYYQTEDHNFVNYPVLYPVSVATDKNIKSSVTFQIGPAAEEIGLDVFNSMEKEMALINRTYWMASCSKSSYYDTSTDVFSRSHRWSEMAVPVRMDLELLITCNKEDWVPFSVTLSKSTAALRKYQFYSTTSQGYFAEYQTKSTTNWTYAATNPDGSPRTNGAYNMPATNHCVIPEVTSTVAAGNVTSISNPAVELGFSDRKLNKLSDRY